jgi:hypothetical protein
VTWGGSAAAIEIAAVVLPAGLAVSNVWTFNNQMNSRLAAGASPPADSAVSGNLPTLNVLPATLIGWCYNDGKNAAPAQSTDLGWTAQGSVWGALGAACLSCETQVVNTSGPWQSAFTPVASQNNVTFAGAFNPPIADLQSQIVL